MRRGILFGVAAFLIAGIAGADFAKEILKDTGVQGGLVVHIGCDDGSLTTALGAKEGYIV